MKPIFYDTETCGLHGMAVLIQWAEGNGPIHLHSVWTVSIRETLALIEKIVKHPGGVVGFNLAFDHFHLCKLYTILSLWHDRDALPEDIVDELAELEMQGRDGPCLKPVSACDLMLHARRGPYQSTMDRGDVRVRRVPTAIAWQVAAELERRVPLKDIYFARRKDKRADKWAVYDITDEDGETNPDFKDVVLKFAPSSALKALAVDALELPQDDVLLFSDVEVDECWYPEERGYAPFAKAVGDRHNWRGAWPEKIRHHIQHWTYHKTARVYAEKDVEYTRALYEHFGSPAMGDDDSELACMVAAVRWRGYAIDVPKLRSLREAALRKIGETPTAPRPVRAYVSEKLDEAERLVLRGSTKRVLLEEIAKWRQPCRCNVGGGIEVIEEDVRPDIVMDFDAPATIMEVRVTGVGAVTCEVCGGIGSVSHPAAVRAREVLDARGAIKEIELYDKLLLAGRFHASFKVIGTLSSRMSGADGLNAQGIKKTKEVRGCFPLAWGGMVLCGGDYAAFEVSLAEACYDDPDLRRDLLTCEGCDSQMEFVGDPVPYSQWFEGADLSIFLDGLVRTETKRAERDQSYVPKTRDQLSCGVFENDFICTECGSNKGKKIHALFGVHVFPDMTYEQIKATDGTADDKYTRCKQAVFAMFYGGEGPTLQDRLGVDLETANKAFERFARRYRRVGVARQRIADMFLSMKQPGGIGTKVEWHEPADKIESMFGFARYFTLENRICRALFDLASSPPRSWRDVKVKVSRRDRVQTAGGAAQSALYSAAFSIQASSMRAGANHEIQSSGAQITKRTQRRIWDLQPAGVREWLVQPCNVHDEIQCPCVPWMVELVARAVKETVEGYRGRVPLIRMDWSSNLRTWADKS